MNWVYYIRWQYKDDMFDFLSLPFDDIGDCVEHCRNYLDAVKREGYSVNGLEVFNIAYGDMHRKKITATFIDGEGKPVKASKPMEKNMLRGWIGSTLYSSEGPYDVRECRVESVA